MEKNIDKITWSQLFEGKGWFRREFSLNGGPTLIGSPDNLKTIHIPTFAELLADKYIASKHQLLSRQATEQKKDINSNQASELQPGYVHEATDKAPLTPQSADTQQCQQIPALEATHCNNNTESSKRVHIKKQAKRRAEKEKENKLITHRIITTWQDQHHQEDETKANTASSPQSAASCSTRNLLSFGGSVPQKPLKHGTNMTHSNDTSKYHENQTLSSSRSDHRQLNHNYIRQQAQCISVNSSTASTSSKQPRSHKSKAVADRNKGPIATSPSDDANDYGYPHVHEIMKLYFQTRNIKYPDPTQLYVFSKKQARSDVTFHSIKKYLIAHITANEADEDEEEQPEDLDEEDEQAQSGAQQNDNVNDNEQETEPAAATEEDQEQVQQEAVDNVEHEAYDNSYGYPQSHGAMETYYKSKNTECTNPMDLILFAKQQALSGATFASANKYFKARKGDSDALSIEAILSRDIPQQLSHSLSMPAPQSQSVATHSGHNKAASVNIHPEAAPEEEDEDEEQDNEDGNASDTSATFGNHAYLIQSDVDSIPQPLHVEHQKQGLSKPPQCIQPVIYQIHHHNYYASKFVNKNITNTSTNAFTVHGDSINNGRLNLSNTTRNAVSHNTAKRKHDNDELLHPPNKKRKLIAS